MNGDILKALRKEKSMTQQELANILEVTDSTISDIEKSKKEPSLNLLTKIADHFNVSTDYLLGRTDKIRLNDTTVIGKNKGHELTENEIKLVKDLYEKLKHNQD